MIGVVALRWRLENGAAHHHAIALVATLRALGWSCPVAHPGWQIWCEPRRGRWMAHILNDGERFVIGRLFDRSATEAGNVADATLPERTESFAALCRRLTESCWGAYVALACDPARPERIEAYRDPVGMAECGTWTSRGVRIVASRPESILPEAPPDGFAIDWSRLSDIMLRPIIVADQLALHGVDIVPPGTLVTIDGGTREARCLWSPASFARPDRMIAGAARVRAELVDACVAAWCSCADSAVAELSGGLDSAIVAAGAVSRAEHPVRSWFHYHVSDGRGDERRFAHAVADRLQLPLAAIFCPDTDIGEPDIDAMPVGIRPGFGSTNLVHDADLSRRAGALGADMLLTGNGGDSLFFQDPSPLIAADLRRDDRSLKDKAAILMHLASWTGTGFWSLAAKASGIGRVGFALPESGCEFLAAGIDRQPDPIGWLVDTDALPPAKRLHLLHLAIARSSFGASWCAERMSVVHPLMSQPLLEQLLPIPAVTLTEGRRDRLLARRAFAGRLPSMLIERRGKGCLTAYYGRRLAASTDFLKDYLLGGVLAAERVIDRARLEPILDPDVLMRSDHYAGLLLALLAERWARAWRDRCRPGTSATPGPPGGPA